MPFTLEQFQIFSEKTLLYLYILNIDGKIISCNERGRLLFSKNNKDIDQRYLTDVMIDEDIAIFNLSVSKLSKKNTVVSNTVRFSWEEDDLLSLKFEFTLHNDLIYAAGLDATEEYKEHRALSTISRLTKTGGWYYNPRNDNMYFSKGTYDIKEVPYNTPLTLEKAASFYDSDLGKEALEKIEKLINDKTSFEYKGRVTTNKGNKKWVKVMGEPVIYKDEVIYINGTCADVTDRHNYIERLKHSEETKHLALKGIQSGLFDYNIQKKEVFYSVDFKKMLGLSLKTDFVHEDEFRKMIHPDDLEKALERHYQNLIEEGNYYHNHYRLKHLKGEYRHYEVFGFRKKNKTGETIRMIGNLIDVHQRKINERTIAINKTKLQAMVNNGFDYIILLNPEGEILMADDRSLKVIKRDFNVDPLEKTSRFIDVMPLNFKNTFAYQFNEALKGNIIKKDIERIGYDNKPQWYESKYTPIIDKHNKVNSVLVSFHDITEQKLAEMVIKDAYIKEQELNVLKSNILSNFSHEIRTPLNGIMTVSKLLLDEKRPQEIDKLVQYLEESKDRLLYTIDSLSNYSEIEAIKNNLHLQDLDLNYTVESSYREYKHLADSKKLKYNIELDETCPKVTLDQNLFRTAINNIIQNAIKYTEQGSINITINSENLENNAYISIIDTGIGIDSENLKKIFDPFMQESIGLNRKYEGTGIGLSLSNRYIEILGGTITVKSEVGKGTVFSIILPKCL
ncbi:PAS domain-containing sensor histidine kinase [Aquimarina pacifica]|uniref:PAS domain-containing sensor histidine kinase n=1 Tax=Aquimarina pacifica TaxID=1296415 RepID=UPI00046FA517|nr:PAS domain-containing sensor histidine kinase [Aquimarina pacifica]